MQWSQNSDQTISFRFEPSIKSIEDNSLNKIVFDVNIDEIYCWELR